MENDTHHSKYIPSKKSIRELVSAVTAVALTYTDSSICHCGWCSCMLDLAPEVRSFVRHRAVGILHCTISTYGNNDCDVETIDCVLQNETPPRDGQPMKGVTYAIRSAL